MLRRHMLLSVLSLSIVPRLASADIPGPISNVPDARQVGKGRLVVLMVPVLDATLFGPGGAWSDKQPFALRVEHLRHLEGDSTARRLISEIRGLGFRDEARLRTWQGQLAQILPDIKAGDNTTVVRTARHSIAFYHRDRFIGEMADSQFCDYFFAICLSPKTSQPTLRRQLLGQV